MPLNLDTWLHSRHDELTRFTTIELRAELLRQRIAELESLPLPSPLLPLLRTELSSISEPAALTSQGRSYQQQLIAMAMEARATGRVPDGASKLTVLREYRAWLERMEEADRVGLRMRFGGGGFGEDWRRESWRGRRELVRVYMRSGAVGVGKIVSFKLAKMAVGWMVWVGRR